MLAKKAEGDEKIVIENKSMVFYPKVFLPKSI